MVITYHGEHYFKLQSGELSLLIDPLNQRSFKGSTAVLYTNFTAEEKNEDGPFVISHAGEYEVKGIRIRGWEQEGAKNPFTLYHIEFDDIGITVLGKSTTFPHPEIIEGLLESDIVIIHIGNKEGLSSSLGTRLIRSLEPSIILPSFENEKEKNLFLKEFDGNSRSEEKVVIKKKDIVKGNSAVIVLSS